MDEFDVVVCGGGLAGQALARQVHRHIPDASIVVIEKLTRPLPQAAFKVGESTVEVGAFYLGQALGLTDYFDQCHHHKLGLRYFFGDSSGPFEDRPEFGLSVFPRVHSYQIDRGILENDLRRFNEADGVVMLEGCSLKDVELSSDVGLHEVTYHKAHEDGLRKLKARWVVDATGRRRFLQHKLNLIKDRVHKCSAAWFRVNGRADVKDLVPATQRDWHDRVPDGNRYFSTNHLMGNGYWVWLIPLSSGSTSIGIVATEDVHPFSEYNTYERAMQWLWNHEPVLAGYLEDKPPLDFRVTRKYSYTSDEVFSYERWACVGEAGVFSDPFYSPGTDMIGFANTITTEMIRRDFDGSLKQLDVKTYNDWFIGVNDVLTHNIQLGYPFFGHALAMAAKLLWDFASGWGYVAPQMFNSTFLDRAESAPLRQVTSSFFLLQARMQQMFADWGSRPKGRCSFDFFDYLSLPFLSNFRLRNLETGKTTEELVDDAKANMVTFEELAQVLFLVAVEDVLPKQAARFREPLWLNAWAVSLNPSRWKQDGLFKPRSKPRDLTEVKDQVLAQVRITRDPTFVAHPHEN